ncbi:MAG: HEAT repeat domain-containing protein, partial [Thermoguttaceae bacterium]|nr:HEAT repeat domain-containing protein [Thermoguttaceae bacterium]
MIGRFGPSGRWLGVLVAALVLGMVRCGAGIEVEFARLTDPSLAPPKPVPAVSSRPLALWIQALASPEADLRREAADTIALAHRLGMPDVQTAVPALREALDAPGQHPLVVAAAARTLIALDAREAAPSL